MARVPPDQWLRHTSEGLACLPGKFVIDPTRPVGKALVTHGHADHARPGNADILATPATLAIMRTRYGSDAGNLQAINYGERLDVNGVGVTFVPAGHVIGSAQICLEYDGSRIVVSGDYKRRRDPTCAPFEPQICDVFVTEATFGLPVFRHPPDRTQIEKLLDARKLFPDRSILLGVYALGKCQRLICLLREAGYDETIFLHGSMIGLCSLYEELGVKLGSIAPLAELAKPDLQGKIVMAPPSALHDRWSRRLPDPVAALASGWMTVRARARQKLVELPLVVSDHADWDELTQTIAETKAPEIWVTHGREDALVHYAQTKGLRARPLDMHGYEDEDD
ncbi:MAG: ligase-associated DNA damage response exonuclease [Pseudomonadota bacterium]|nr:ligase-associated DNA damage response exonuclease [Pseudomonadota bacterium]